MVTNVLEFHPESYGFTEELNDSYFKFFSETEDGLEFITARNSQMLVAVTEDQFKNWSSHIITAVYVTGERNDY